MATGHITRLNLSNGKGTKFGFVTCPGRAELRFEESDLLNAEMTADLQGRSVVYNEEFNGRASGVRVVD